MAHSLLLLTAALALAFGLPWLAWRATTDRYLLDHEALVIERRFAGIRVLRLRIQLNRLVAVRELPAFSIPQAAWGDGHRLGWPILLGSPFKASLLLVRERAFFDRVLITPEPGSELPARLRSLLLKRHDEAPTKEIP